MHISRANFYLPRKHTIFTNGNIFVPTEYIYTLCSSITTYFDSSIGANDEYMPRKFNIVTNNKIVIIPFKYYF